MEKAIDDAKNNVPKVNSCCCGLFSLKVGTYIIGVVSFLVELGAHGYFLTYYPHTGIVYKIYIGLIITGLVAAVLLIIGVFYNEPRFVLFFLVIDALLLITTITLVAMCYIQDYGVHDHYVNDLIDTAVYCALIIYCMIVVYNYYITM